MLKPIAIRPLPENADSRAVVACRRVVSTVSVAHAWQAWPRT